MSEVSREEMRAYVVGKASVEVRRKVRDQLQVPGSFADTWLKSFLSAAGDPFAISLTELLQEDSPSEGEIFTHTNSDAAESLHHDSKEIRLSEQSLKEDSAKYGLPLPAMALGDNEPETKGQTYRWGPILIPPEDNRCSWELGDATMAQGENARMDADWTFNGVLTVRISGFLHVGKGSILEVRWLSADGTEKARGTPENIFSGIVILTPPDAQPPQADDLLHIRHAGQSSDDRAWIVTIITPMGNGSQ